MNAFVKERKCSNLIIKHLPVKWFVDLSNVLKLKEFYTIQLYEGSN